ncbi:MAG: helix-turn-helix transcriptional regulator [Alphaproteobacteria bacterium]|nr:helix-turn-helix transcriptional regulator [Alphaproteobacteria bacterium]
MPTGKQIRAARMLIDWEAKDLARTAQLSPETIFKIERGTANPKPDTMERIVRALHNGGVVFDGERGIRLVLEDYRVLEGGDCYLRFLDEIYHTLRGKNGAEVLSICTDDAVSPTEVTQAIQRWHDEGIKCRFLSHDKTKKFDFPLQEYRLIPTKFFKNSVIVIYEDNAAILRSSNETVIVIRDQDLASMLRGLFELVWSIAKGVDK